MTESVIFRALRFWMQLSWLQRRVIVRAVVWLGLTDLGLRVFGLRRLIELVPVAPTTASPSVPGHISMYAAILELVAHYYVVPTHCLHKSLVLQFWLRREGIPSQLRIGVRKEDRQLLAHAWVELYGQVVNDDPVAISVFRPLSTPRWVTSVGWDGSVNSRTRCADSTRSRKAWVNR